MLAAATPTHPLGAIQKTKRTHRVVFVVVGLWLGMMVLRSSGVDNDGYKVVVPDVDGDEWEGGGAWWRVASNNNALKRCSNTYGQEYWRFEDSISTKVHTVSTRHPGRSLRLEPLSSEAYTSIAVLITVASKNRHCSNVSFKTHDHRS
nr:hypothetical protein [Tanacetum cinerariifolium]